MPFVTIDDQLRVVLPAGLVRDLGLKAGDLLEATVAGDALRLRPRHAPDRARVVAELDALLAAYPVSSEDEGKTEDDIVDEITQDIAACRAEQRSLGG